MNFPDTANANMWNSPGEQQGFCFSYYCNNYRTSSTFNEASCDEVIRNFFHFMLGCGFSMTNVAEYMVSISEEHQESEFGMATGRLDIPGKWNITNEETENA